MALPGFFSAELPGAESLWLEQATARHIVQVLRMKTGAMIRLTNGRGESVLAEILETGKKGCRVLAGERNMQPEPERQVIMAVSLLKNTSRFEWFLEKATELGVRRIIPLLCSRTEKQHFRRDRMHSILVSAMIQSQQSWLPQLDEPMAFASFTKLDLPGAAGIGFCGEGEKLDLKDFPGLHNPRCRFAIGPEGDFTGEEMELAGAAGFITVSLGLQRLRTETAAMAAAVMLQLGSR